jgi:hypothetical protein
MLALYELVGWHTMDGDALEGVCRLFIHCHLQHVADVRSVLPAPSAKNVTSWKEVPYPYPTV